MNIIDYIIISALALWTFAAIGIIIKNRKSGKRCCGGCDSCGGCGVRADYRRSCDDLRANDCVAECGGNCKLCGKCGHATGWSTRGRRSDKSVNEQ